MARRDRRSTSREQSTDPQNDTPTLSPDKVLDTTDPGDETQQRYRYQHAYGVILLAGSIRQELPYTAIWCEHHEDLLGERSDGLYDAYQIKTRRPEYGLWNLADEAVKNSIKRFVELEQLFPGKTHEFCFVSNTSYENSNARNKIGNSPVKFQKAIKKVTTEAELSPPFDQTFATLCAYCGCAPSNLITVIKKLKLISGPGLDDYETVIAAQHLSHLPDCTSWPMAALEILRNELIARVYEASSLSYDDPATGVICMEKTDSIPVFAQKKSLWII